MHRFLAALKAIVVWPYTFVVGMGITEKFFARKAVTIQYPQQKRQIADAWRGLLAHRSDETGKSTCIACLMCQRVCPAKAIKIETVQVEGQKKRQLASFTVDMSKCVFCGMCEEVCPVKTIFLTKAYDLTGYSPDQLVYDLPKLVRQGRHTTEAV